MAKTVETAMTLMLMAASLLDKAGERDGAGQLREAIDVVRTCPGLTAADLPAARDAQASATHSRFARLAGMFRRTHIT